VRRRRPISGEKPYEFRDHRPSEACELLKNDFCYENGTGRILASRESIAVVWRTPAAVYLQESALKVRSDCLVVRATIGHLLDVIGQNPGYRVVF